MVDWSLARQVARFAGGPPPAAGPAFDLRQRVLDLEGPVAGYTRLEPGQPLPPAETVDRRTWADVNIATLRSLLEPMTGRLGAGIGGGGPLGGPTRVFAGMALGVEVGLVMGYMSQRVLGQYELSLIQPAAPARLLFVGPNVERAVAEMAVDRDSFLTWLALHELTHAFEFSGVPWLRGHLGGLVREYLSSVELRLRRSASGGGLPWPPDPARIAASFRSGGLAELVQTPQQRGILERIQAVMAVVEGYSEHVMDAVGEHVVDRYDGLREAMERRRRNRSAPERALQRLLGFDLKLRQYELGKRFCDGVVERQGMTGLNRVWSAPRSLPTLTELDHPDEWLARLERERALPAGA